MFNCSSGRQTSARWRCRLPQSLMTGPKHSRSGIWRSRDHKPLRSSAPSKAFPEGERGPSLRKVSLPGSPGGRLELHHTFRNAGRRVGEVVSPAQAQQLCPGAGQYVRESQTPTPALRVAVWETRLVVRPLGVQRGRSVCRNLSSFLGSCESPCRQGILAAASPTLRCASHQREPQPSGEAGQMFARES